MNIDFSHFLKDQSFEETIAVLDEVLGILVVHTGCVGLSDAFTHQYLTLRNLRNRFIEQQAKGSLKRC